MKEIQLRHNRPSFIVELVSDTDFIQLVPDEEMDIDYSDPVRIKALSCEGDLIKVAISHPDWIMLEHISTDHPHYKVFKDRLKDREVPFNPYYIKQGQSVLIEPDEEASQEEIYHDMMNVGVLIGVVEGNIQSDWNALLLVSASDKHKVRDNKMFG